MTRRILDSISCWSRAHTSYSWSPRNTNGRGNSYSEYQTPSARAIWSRNARDSHPSTLLAQKSRGLKSIPGNFSSTELYSKQWRQVQHLANMFWTRWRKEYLPTLQPRREEAKRDQEPRGRRFGCNESPRNYWPLARITKPYVSTDGKVRKVDLVTAKEGSTRSYTRPVTEAILLKSEKDFEKIKTPLGLTKFSDRLVKCLENLLQINLVTLTDEGFTSRLLRGTSSWIRVRKITILQQSSNHCDGTDCKDECSSISNTDVSVSVSVLNMSM